MIVIKIGGNMVNKLPNTFFNQIKQLQEAGETILIVHGGGHLISACGEFVGQPATKVNGIRVTNPQMMAITDTVLTQIIQPALNQQFTAHGIASMPLNTNGANHLHGTYIDQAQYGEVGTVNQVQLTDWTQSAQPTVGICACTAIGPHRTKLNVNADMAAEAIARLTHADQLVLLTDVPGVMLNQHVLSKLDHATAHQLLANEQLINGMVPKVKAAFRALDSGIANVSITNDLNHVGTAIVN